LPTTSTRYRASCDNDFQYSIRHLHPQQLGIDTVPLFCDTNLCARNILSCSVLCSFLSASCPQLHVSHVHPLISLSYHLPPRGTCGTLGILIVLQLFSSPHFSSFPPLSSPPLTVSSPRTFEAAINLLYYYQQHFPPATQSAVMRNMTNSQATRISTQTTHVLCLTRCHPHQTL
jgi:hypothetical protein